MRIIILSSFILVCFCMFLFKSSAAYFSADAISNNNIFNTAESFITISPTPPASPTPTQAPCSECCGGEINAEISGNGDGSINEIDVNFDCETEINQENNATINNYIDITSASSVSATIENELNTNIIN